ncbi:transposase [Rhodobacterales bacterium HKCCE4037]|nr:transposase [Rhodobacterales bacterium HKCCE4037]
MPNYTRPRRPGASIFFTVTLSERTSDLLTREIEILRQSVRKTLQERPVKIDAWVVLPDHMHCVWTLPEGDTDYANRWRIIKARFSRKMPDGHRRASHMGRREHGLWQRRFWEHHIRDPADWQNHVAYCWNNPVKHGLAGEPGDWPFSSWHRDHGQTPP